MKQKRQKPRDAQRRGKKKVSVLVTERIEYVDWKDANLLRRFMSDRAKVRARRVTGNNAQQQREIAKAIRNAREMALIPYTSRVTTQRGRGGRDRDDDDRRRGPRDGARPPAKPEFEALEETETDGAATEVEETSVEESTGEDQ